MTVGASEADVRATLALTAAKHKTSKDGGEKERSCRLGDGRRGIVRGRAARVPTLRKRRGGRRGGRAADSAVPARIRFAQARAGSRPSVAAGEVAALKAELARAQSRIDTLESAVERLFTELGLSR